MSSTELARRVGVTKQAVSQLVSGQTVPSFWRLHDIADALGVRVRDLFTE